MPPSPPAARARVLVVDDDADIRALLATVLADAGCHVDLAPDGEAALALAALHPPDAVVLDLLLPDTTGWEVANRLGQQIGRPVPIVIASGAHARLFRLPPHVACVIPKPFDPDSVVRAVQSVLRATRHADSASAA